MLFYITIFLLPTNLFRVWRPADAYLAGHFIDYLAPKLYLSQLAIGSLWLFTLLSTRGRAHLWAHFPFLRRAAVLLVSLSCFVVAHFLWWQDLSVVWWSLTFLTGPVALGLWLVLFPVWRTVGLWRSLLVATTFQASVGLYQTWWQKSVGGFWFLGEPSFGPERGLALSHWGAATYLPYGTTPHPNVLAAWIITGILSLNIIVYINKKMTLFEIMAAVILGVALWFTESWTAWLTLPLFLASGPVVRWLEQRRFGLSSVKKGALGLVIMSQVIWLSWPYWWSSPATLPGLAPESITRRVHLQRKALELLQEHPWSYSLKNTYQSVFEAETRYSGTRFLQPVHHAGLYIVIVFGICSILLLSFFMYFDQKYYPLVFLVFLGASPIFNLDHYLTSLLSGQYILLFVLAYFAFLTKRLDHNN